MVLRFLRRTLAEFLKEENVKVVPPIHPQLSRMGEDNLSTLFRSCLLRDPEADTHSGLSRKSNLSVANIDKPKGLFRLLLQIQDQTIALDTTSTDEVALVADSEPSEGIA